MIITKIERQKATPHRVNIYCDDQFAFAIHTDVLMKFGLREGDALDENTFSKLQSAEEFTRAYEKALRFIGYRLRSEREVRAKLRDAEFPPSIINAVAGHLSHIRLLDDNAFAKAFVHDTLMKKPAGAKLLRQQLRLKGVSAAIIDDVLRERFDRDAEVALARQAAEKHLRKDKYRSSKLEREKDKRRLAQLLTRRGFSWDAVSSVLKEFFPRT